MLALLLAAGEAPKVEVVTLEGRTVTGTLSALSPQGAVVDASEPQRFPVSELLEIRCPDVKAPPLDPTVPVIAVRWQSGAMLTANAVTLSSNSAKCMHRALGDVTLARDAVRSLRFGADDAPVRETWKQLHERSTKKDFLVVRKGDVLDHLDGVAGTVDASEVRFRLDGEDVVVKREKVYGVIFARREEASVRSAAKVELAGGDTLLVKDAQWSNGEWQFTVPGVPPVKAASTAVQAIDFSISKFQYLSTMEPREYEYTSWFGDRTFEYQRDRDFDGRPLRVGDRTFPRGLAVHSKTELKYRLGGDYRRFKAVVGLDPKLPLGAAYGDAHVAIRGDGKLLFEGDFISGQPPEILDLPVTSVNELEVLVDYGRDKWDLGDRVHFGDAKVVK